MIDDTAGTSEGHDLVMMRRCQHLRGAIRFAAVCVWTVAAIAPLEAASAVATGINPKNGRLSFGYWKGAASENQARQRAMHYCLSMGYVNSKLIDSTSKTGYGAVVWFETADGRSHCAVSLAAPTQQQAISRALRKAKAAGGRYATVDATFHDMPSKARDVIKL